MAAKRKRRVRRRSHSRSQVGAARPERVPPGVVAGASTSSGVDRRVEQSASRITAAARDLDRRFDKAMRRPVVTRRTGIGAWLRHPLQSLRTAMLRRRRGRLASRLDRALARHDADAAEQSSAALLAVLTERVARTAARHGPAGDLADSIELAELVVRRYEESVARVMEQRAHARAQIATWAHRESRAADAGDGGLAAAAGGRRDEWTRIETELAATVAEYERGHQRLEDAVTQLRALATRTRESPG